jgi:hypothetical protein
MNCTLYYYPTFQYLPMPNLIPGFHPIFSATNDLEWLNKFHAIATFEFKRFVGRVYFDGDGDG